MTQDTLAKPICDVRWLGRLDYNEAWELQRDLARQRAAGDIPDWAPLAPGASEPQGTYSTRSGDEISGAFTYTTSSSTSDVLAFYDRTLSDEGYEVSKSTFSTGGEASGMVSGVNKSTGRNVSAMVGADEGTTQVTVSYSSGG